MVFFLDLTKIYSYIFSFVFFQYASPAYSVHAAPQNFIITIQFSILIFMLGMNKTYVAVQWTHVFC